MSICGSEWKEKEKLENNHFHHFNLTEEKKEKSVFLKFNCLWKMGWTDEETIRTATDSHEKILEDKH